MQVLSAFVVVFNTLAYAISRCMHDRIKYLASTSRYCKYLALNSSQVLESVLYIMHTISSTCEQFRTLFGLDLICYIRVNNVFFFIFGT